MHLQWRGRRQQMTKFSAFTGAAFVLRRTFNVRCGSIASLPEQTKIDLCPLFPNRVLNGAARGAQQKALGGLSGPRAFVFCDRCIVQQIIA